MRFYVLTLFPEMIEQGLATSITGRAMQKGLVSLDAVNIRDYAANKHRKVDDYTYGGGAGMLMQAQPVYDACMAVQNTLEKPARVVYMTPQGSTFNQTKAQELAQEEDLIILCGHYEGIDERVLEEIVTDEISIGDYVLYGRRAAGHGGHRHGIQADPGRARKRRLRGHGFLYERASGIPPVLEARGLERQKSTSGASVR